MLPLGAGVLLAHLSLLSHLPNMEAWKENLEKEYQQFMKTMTDWKQLRAEWYEQKRQEFAEKKQELQDKWQHAAVRTRFMEMEYMLKMQRKRLQLFNMNFASFA